MTAKITSPEVTTAQKKQFARHIEDVMVALGFTKEDAQRILENGGILKERLVPILKDLATVKSPALIHAAKHIPNGWKIVRGEDVAPTLTSVKELEPIEFFIGDELNVFGEEMRKRGIEKQATLGLSDAAWLLEHQSQIPTWMREHILIFTGTRLYDLAGIDRVTILCWYVGRWCLSFAPLTVPFSRDDRLTRRKST